MLHLILSNPSTTHNPLGFSISGSKSISQRALIINYLSGCNYQINNLSNSSDTLLLHNAIQSKKTIINVENSGTTLRFSLSLFALQNREITLIGDKYLFQRPIKLLIDSLNILGANIIKKENNIIIKRGNLIGGELDFKSINTSQFISSLLLIAPYLKGGIKLNFPKKLYSKSYIQMTLSIMNSCGAHSHISDGTIKILEGNYKKKYIIVESDWTSASYLFTSFLFSKLNHIKITSFSKDSIQPDSMLINFFSIFGIRSDFNKNELSLKRDPDVSIPKKIQWNFNNNPDLCPTILVVCLGLGVELYATGIKTLAYKESNRIVSMQRELSKFNCWINIKSNKFIHLKPSKKQKKDKPITVETYNDHRIALSFSPLVLLGWQLKINNPEVIKKSYPNFWCDLVKFGVKIKNQNH